MDMSWLRQAASNNGTSTKKLRFACDPCHHAKIKCSGGNPCAGCIYSAIECVRSPSNRVGRPKGTRNRRTLEFMNRRNQAQETRHGGSENIDNINATNTIENGSSSINVPQKQQLPQSSSSPSLPQQQSSPRHPAQLEATSSATFGNDMNKSLSVFSNLFTTVPENNSDLSYLLPNDLALEGAESGGNGPSSAKDIFANPPLQSGLQVGPGMRSYTASGTDNKHGFPDREDSQTRVRPSDSLVSEGSGSLEYFSLPITPLSPVSPESSKCNCLQYHAKLLCLLQELQQSPTTPSVDVVLNGVQQALVPWSYFAQCRICQRDGDQEQEILILSAMSIRAVLRLLQGICFDMALTADGWNEDVFLQGEQQVIVTPGGSKLSVGTHEITGEERTLVLHLLITRTLGKVRLALEHLSERSSKKGSTTPPLNSNGSSLGIYDRNHSVDSDHVQQLLGGLASTIQRLSRTLKSVGESVVYNNT